jgi:DNA-binding GntR family transcriptional regulator
MKTTEHTKNAGRNSTDTAFLALRDLIVDGKLAPGSWIVEADLTAVLNVSRTPIRSALQWLQHEGYVVARGTGAKTRMMVAALTLNDARELYAIVGRIEGLAGRLTASLPTKPRTGLATRLKKLNSELTKTARSSHPDTEQFVNTDTMFHDIIVEACSGRRLLAIYEAIKPQTDRYWRLYPSTGVEDMKDSCQEHEAIVEAIAKGDGDATERALQINWEKGAERLAKAIMRFGERGNW